MEGFIHTDKNYCVRFIDLTEKKLSLLGSGRTSGPSKQHGPLLGLLPRRTSPGAPTGRRDPRRGRQNPALAKFPPTPADDCRFNDAVASRSDASDDRSALLRVEI